MSTKQLRCVNLTQQDNVPFCAPGTKHITPAGDTYRYVQAQAAKTVSLAYGIDENWEVSAAAVIETDHSPLLGVPAFTSSAPASGFTYKYFWIQTAGNFAGIVTGNDVADNAGVYTCNAGSEGKVDDGDDTGKLIRGWKFTSGAVAPATATVFAAEEASLDQA